MDDRADRGADALRPVPYRIARRWQELPDTFTWSLRPAQGRAPFAFAPGQFNMLYGFGLGEVAISISGNPEEGMDLVHTIRAVGSVTRRLASLQAGAMVGVRGPFGRPWPIVEAEGDDIVFMAGGLGLAPLRPAILHVLNHRGRYGRVLLLYGARSPAELLYVEQLKEWGGRFDMDVEVTVDTAAKHWHGSVGMVTRLLRFVAVESSATTALVCGPEIMMRFGARALQDLGVPADRIFLSMERNMKCGVVQCGHCQWGPHFVCKDGPVFAFGDIETLLSIREV